MLFALFLMYILNVKNQNAVPDALELMLFLYQQIHMQMQVILWRSGTLITVFIYL